MNNENNFNGQPNGFKSFDQMNDEFRKSQNGQNVYNHKNHENYIPYYYNQNNNMYDSYVNKNNISSSPSKEKLRYGKVFIPILIIIVLVLLSFTGYKIYQEFSKKNRTFMIYMVGSDLESKSKQGTYSISDIVDGNIDLENNNVILMTGGSKKWHNFVSENEIGMYKLTESGFEKIKSIPIESMGTSSNLSNFLNYVYENFPSKKYDMIFWNHGLGAMGIEQDEVSNDYLSIKELDSAFQDSHFKDNKMELTIFYNCLASNLHIAKIMSNYSDYMVASEEVFYLSKILNRLNFLESVKTDDTAYDIGYSFIKQSDKVISSYNSSHFSKLDSTLSILDLNAVKNLDEKFNEFISTINLTNNYYTIAYLRSNLYTYGRSQTSDYDTIDMYELVQALTPLSSNKSKSVDVLNELNNVVMYTSNLNNHSNGISIYFPYFGSDTAVELHLNMFKKLWNDSYLNFIEFFHEKRVDAKTNIRSMTGKNVNKLKNKISNKGEKIKIKLTEEEKKNYQHSYVYLFKKDSDNNYDLVLKSNNVIKGDDVLSYDADKILKINGKVISFIEDDEKYAYGTLYDKDDVLDVIEVINFEQKVGTIVRSLLDSGNNPISGLIEYKDYPSISFYNLKYNLLENNDLRENFKETLEKENIEFEKDKLEITLDKNDLDEYYVMFEVYDIHNDIFYSDLKKVTK